MVAEISSSGFDSLQALLSKISYHKDCDIDVIRGKKNYISVFQIHKFREYSTMYVPDRTNSTTGG